MDNGRGSYGQRGAATWGCQPAADRSRRRTSSLTCLKSVASIQSARELKADTRRRVGDARPVARATPDEIDNIRGLCPNHHVLFDLSAFGIEPADYTLIGLRGIPDVKDLDRAGPRCA